MLRQLFLDQNSHVEFYQNNIIVKNNETKAQIKLKQKGSLCDVFRIKNSELLAYVETSSDNATVPIGKTSLIDMKRLKVIAIIEVPLSKKSLYLKNEILIGISGKTVVLYNLKIHSSTVFTLQREILKELVAVADNAFMALYAGKPATYHSVVPESLRCDFHFSIDQFESVIRIDQKRFLAQMKSDASSHWKLYQKTHTTPQILKENSHDALLECKNNIFFPESEMVVILTNAGEVFYTSLEDICFHKIDTNFPKKIDDIFLTTKNQLLVIFSDGSSLDLTRHWSSKNIARRLYDDVFYPHVLADIIAKYAGISFFEKSPKKDPELDLQQTTIKKGHSNV